MDKSSLMISKPNIFILIFLSKQWSTLRSVSTCFFIFWYFWLESTMFDTNGCEERLITPQRLFPSLCCCFSFSSLTYIVIKWICFNKFSMYSSSILRFGLSPRKVEPLFYFDIPSTLWKKYAFLPKK